ncbi:hypothetical protein [Acuticoccus sediminis]|uniref:hypothetical protein n=1 Tax=Acuticoccus sediminis TaxID=2184697 RepID=UPI00192E4B24|nr:hypothetical protein [Acuticoccus sediminis]
MLAESDVSIARKVEVLREPSSYAHRPPTVDVVETHVSWVFLAGDLVYKLKKPVRNRYFDFTTAAKRKANGDDEVRLNRRLSPEVYLGLATLTLGRGGTLALNGSGPVVDWLVVMRRLPAARMLDRMLAGGQVSAAEIDRVAATLGRFYAAAARADITARDYVRHFGEMQVQNRRVIHQVLSGDELTTAEDTLVRLDAAIVAHAATLARRVADGRVVDGHGDLRPEHICLTEPVAIFDCLEFNGALRRVDPLDEIAFLGMECRLIGAPAFGRELARRVLGHLEETPDWGLFAFYAGFRAVLRARLSLAHLLDPAPREAGRWRPQANRYFALARDHLAGHT